MTGSDLNSSSKSWDSQEATTSIIYQEFYEQVHFCVTYNESLHRERDIRKIENFSIFEVLSELLLNTHDSKSDI